MESHIDLGSKKRNEFQTLIGGGGFERTASSRCESENKDRIRNGAAFEFESKETETKESEIRYQIKEEIKQRKEETELDL